jgi:hypothetical protein
MKWVWGFDGTKVNLDKCGSIKIGPDAEQKWVIIKAWFGPADFILDKIPILNRGAEAVNSAISKAKKYVDEITGE